MLPTLFCSPTTISTFSHLIPRLGLASSGSASIARKDFWILMCCPWGWYMHPHTHLHLTYLCTVVHLPRALASNRHRAVFTDPGWEGYGVWQPRKYDFTSGGEVA